ncbi:MULTISPECIES: hypothetical protein [Dactylosporangium]|uniref:Uncharacterized protein n=2 Tax=Dactylosporangium TaxID=35753 RepID=A0A9W6NMM8_9ACTN|nr:MULTISPECIES: hypothetical protein [Dactylosporangium]UAB94929.1 hypothetical protein Dvina_43780 [Dactylosporangium vinaceum]UWZ43298.1 hypothetical protein Dmats_38380 [Dactylosporangium matsuzakiense]GLL02594.1 hypothetical protein GCM10017581_043360 [Dactylosporangium matsuzakiense]
MRYGGRLNRLEFTALIDQQAGRVRASATTLPLYGPVGWSGPCRLGPWGWENDRLAQAGLHFGGPEAWIEIITTAGPPLPELLNLRLSGSGELPDDGSLDATERITIIVDGTPRECSLWPDEPLGESLGRGWLAILDEVPGLLLRGSGIGPAGIALARTGDIEPLLTGTRDHLLAGYDAFGAG